MKLSTDSSSSASVFHAPKVSFLAPTLANPAAERAVIAALIRNPDPQTILQLGIEPDLFAMPETGEALRAILALLADGVAPDAATFQSALSPATLIETETSLAENVSAARLPAYIQILKRCRTERQQQTQRQWLMQAVQAGRPAAEIRTITDALEALECPEKHHRSFQNLSALLDTPPIENWLVKGFFAADSTNVIFGDTGTGKSFVTIDLLCHIAAGLPWCGCPVKKGKVLYIAGEGQNGIIRRFKAWFEAHPGHDDAKLNIQIRTTPAALCDPDSTAALIDEIADMPDTPLAIAIDTLARNFGPGDENSTQDMTQFVAALDALRAVTQAAILVPHHSGHGDKTRGRGSSVLRAAVDGEYLVEKSDSIIRMRCSKMKDSEPHLPVAWTLTRQALPWADEDGTFMNSAVLVPVLDADMEEQRGTFYKQRLSPAQRIAQDALRTALIQHGVEVDGAVTVTEEQWRQAAYSAGISGSDQPRAVRLAFQRARQELVAGQQVSTHDGLYWLPQLRGTKGNKGEHCTVLFPGIAVRGEEQRGTSPFRGCSFVPPPADTPLAEQTEKPNLTRSLTATRILDCLADDLAGMAEETLISAACGKAGTALTQATINALLLAGKIHRVNGRLVAGCGL